MISKLVYNDDTEDESVDGVFVVVGTCPSVLMLAVDGCEVDGCDDGDEEEEEEGVDSNSDGVVMVNQVIHHTTTKTTEEEGKGLVFMLQRPFYANQLKSIHQNE